MGQAGFWKKVSSSKGLGVPEGRFCPGTPLGTVKGERPMEEKTPAKAKKKEVRATGRGGKYNFPSAGLKRLEDDDEKRVFIGKALHNILAVSKAFEAPPKNDDEMCERLNWFFKTCEETNQLPTVEKMCLALSWCRQHVFEIESGKARGFSPITSDIIKKAKNLIASLDAELALEGKIQPVVYMFRSKNFYGMKDQQDVVVTPNHSNDYADQATIEQKYAELPTPDES